MGFGDKVYQDYPLSYEGEQYHPLSKILLVFSIGLFISCLLVTTQLTHRPVYYTVPSPIILSLTKTDPIVLSTAPVVSASTIMAAAPTITPHSESITVSKKDTLATIFSRLKLDNQLAAKVSKLPYSRKILRNLRLNSQMTVLLDAGNQLQQLNYPINDLTILQITNNQKTLKEKVIHIQPKTRLAYAGGAMHGSLTHTATSKNLDTKVIAQLSRIFKDKINFTKDIRKGDHFNLLYQEQYVGDKKIKTGDIVAAQVVMHNQSYSAVRYVDLQGHVDYYTPEGVSLHKGFLRFPLRFSRISSRFSPHRLNPVTHQLLPHRGVDLAAPQGMPVGTTADGRVSFVGRKNGYGNTVVIQHVGGYTTLYAHLKNFMKGLHSGSSVRQGQTIGYVGSTGRTTGTHLHYEVSVDKVQRNPLTIALPAGAPLTKHERVRFVSFAQRLMTQLELSTRVKLVSNPQPNQKIK